MRNRSDGTLEDWEDQLIERSDESDWGVSRPKNEAAVALGRRGGLKGGKARAQALSPSRRSEIARAAAKARWKKPEPDG